MTPHAAAGPLPSDAYAPFARAFNAAAPTYDADYGPANAIMTAFRARSLAVLDAALPREGLLLELGCGTGVEAAALARIAPERRILATDLSPEMLKQAQQRAAAEGVAAQLEWRQMAAGAVGTLAQAYPGGFAGAYSSFGALNCEPDLRRVAAGLAALLPPAAPFVLSVINRWCLWEMAWYGAHGDWARARRRARPIPPARFPDHPHSRSIPREGGPGGLGLTSLPIRYFTPSDMRCAFAPYFVVERQEGMGVALPPPSLAPWLARRPRLASLLTGWERRLRSVPAAAWLGDHVLMVLRRTAVPAEAA